MEFVFPSLHLLGVRLDMRGTGLGLCGGKKKWSKLEQAWPAYNFPFLGATKASPLALQPQPNTPSVLPNTHIYIQHLFNQFSFLQVTIFGSPWTAIYGKPGKAFQVRKTIIWYYCNINLKTLHYNTTVTNNVTFFFTIFFLVLLQIPPGDLGVKWAKIPWDTDILVIQDRSLVRFTCSLLFS